LPAEKDFNLIFVFKNYVFCSVILVFSMFHFNSCSWRVFPLHCYQQLNATIIQSATLDLLLSVGTYGQTVGRTTFWPSKYTSTPKY